MDMVEEDLQKLILTQEDVEGLAQDRQQWKALVDMVSSMHNDDVPV